MRSKLLKRLGIGLLTVFLLVLIGITAFVFDPFEGSVDDVRRIVPRDVDFFVRKTGLNDDFSEFPEPVFWTELKQTEEFRRLATGPTGLDLGPDLEDFAVQMRDIDAQLGDGSGGLVSLLGDTIGDELIVAGRFAGKDLDETALCVFLRVSWKVRAGWGLVEWESTRDSVAESGGPQMTMRDDGVLEIVPQGGEPSYAARYRDCLMVANDEKLLLDSLRLAEDGGESFGQSGFYLDDITGQLESWRERTGVSVGDTNALEMFVRPIALFERTEFDDGWPDPNHPESIEQRIFASFLNLRGWKHLTGGLVFEDVGGQNSLTMLGDIRLDPNEHTSFQADFFRSESQQRDKWLDPFLKLVPRDSCAAAALRVPAGDFLQQMVRAADQDLVSEVDGMLKQTGTYSSLDDLIRQIQQPLDPRIGVVFKRKQDPNKFGFSGAPGQEFQKIESFDPDGSPDFAWVFWLDDRMGNSKLQGLINYLDQNQRTFGFRRYNLPIKENSGVYAREFANNNIPGTGEIVTCLFGTEFFVLSNSGPLVVDMVNAYLDGRNLKSSAVYSDKVEPELDRKLNGFMYFDGARLDEVVEDLIEFERSASADPSPDWMVEVRPTIERDVLRKSFPGIRSRARLQGDQVTKFEELVVAEMKRQWPSVAEQQLGESIRSMREDQALFRLLEAGFVQLEMEPRALRWQGRALFRF